MSQLLPCPFCGGEATLWEGDWASGDHGVCCKKCGLTVDPSGHTLLQDNETSEEWAIRAWNTRHPQQDVQGLVEALKEAREYSLGTAGDDSVIYRIIDKALKSYQEGGL